MVKIEDVKQKLSQTVAAGTACFTKDAEWDYELLNAHVIELEELSREAIQAQLRTECEKVLDQLDKGQPLTPQQLSTVRVFIVGESEAYVKSEKEVDTWRAEIRRLFGELEQLGAIDGVDSLLQLRAICLETIRVIPDLTFYLEQKERIQKFDAATSKPLEADTAKVLREILQSMLISENM
jgi:hypothetical protein